jgi:hypothetical protein
MSTAYQTINSKKGRLKSENLQEKKETPVVYKEDVIPLSEQSGLVQTPLIDYLLRIEILQLPDAGDRALFFHHVEEYIKAGDAEDVFLQIAQKNFDKPIDFRKIFYLCEGVKLVEPYHGKWKVAQRIDRPYLIELLTRCGGDSHLMDMINQYKSPKQKREEEMELWMYPTKRSIQTTENIGED